ncbi:MAG: Tad domain-containing protein [Chloroflexota bacterium]
MIQKTCNSKPASSPDNRQSGQSIAIIALALIGILAFVGIAVDVGFIFQRSSKLQSAVDSAALAGVTELPSGMAAADQKAGQFLNANNLPIEVTQSLQSATNRTPIGEDQYAITVTWPVELYFLRLIGLESYDLTRSATAAYFPQADIYASRRVDQGLVNTSNQSVFGPHICTSWGDPFSPIQSAFRAENPPYAYKYRILIPSDYPDDVLRVELYDPDSYNENVTSASVIHSRTAQLANPSQFPTTPVNMNCSNSGQKYVCNINTGESNLVGTNGITIDHINPFWIVRIDENRGDGTATSAFDCRSTSTYDARWNTETLYELFYYRENEDGTLEEVPMARYTGQVKDGGARDNGEHDTDLRWVSPGGAQSFDQPVFVPVDPGTPTNPATGSPYTFDININRDLPDILTEEGSGNRYVYLNVTSLPPGGSENGFEIWAGPDDYIDTTPSNVNTRNLYILNNPGSHYSKGATVFGLGRLPMNSNTSNRVNIPLMYVGPEMAGGTIYVDIFDPDAGAKPPVIFYFDSIAFKASNTTWDGVDWSKTDWAVSYGGNNNSVFGCFRNGNSYSGGCNNQWVNYQITVPGDDTACFTHPTRGTQCIPFYGGRFSANYKGGENDTYGWQIRVVGAPYLVK